MDFLTLQRALEKKQSNTKKEFTPADINALEYFSSMEEEHDKLFDKAFGEYEFLDALDEMFDIVDMESEAIPMSFKEMIAFL